MYVSVVGGYQYPKWGTLIMFQTPRRTNGNSPSGISYCIYVVYTIRLDNISSLQFTMWCFPTTVRTYSCIQCSCFLLFGMSDQKCGPTLRLVQNGVNMRVASLFQGLQGIELQYSLCISLRQTVDKYVYARALAEYAYM